MVPDMAIKMLLHQTRSFLRTLIREIWIIFSIQSSFNLATARIYFKETLLQRILKPLRIPPVITIECKKSTLEIWQPMTSSSLASGSSSISSMLTIWITSLVSWLKKRPGASVTSLSMRLLTTQIQLARVSMLFLLISMSLMRTWQGRLMLSERREVTKLSTTSFTLSIFQLNRPLIMCQSFWLSI